MVIYYVNAGRFPTFAEANRYRRDRIPHGAGHVLNCGGTYTVRLLATPKKAEADRWTSAGRGDIWISERDTSLKEET